MKRKYSGELRLDEKGLRKICGNGNGKPVFICSANDLFAEAVPAEIIEAVLERCCQYDDEYLFHTKNPKRVNEYWEQLPDRASIAVTIETNLDTRLISRAPSPKLRLDMLQYLHVDILRGAAEARPLMVTVEPVLDFDLGFVSALSYIRPNRINIGADSGGNGLMEPSPEKLRAFIKDVREFCSDVRLKANLKRLLPTVVGDE